ncbi:MAG: hypothetical protein ACHQUC_02950 [Chlamydiales bacterium]
MFTYPDLFSGYLTSNRALSHLNEVSVEDHFSQADWVEKLIESCSKLPVEQLSDFFNRTVPKMIDTIDLSQLQKALQITETSEHAVQMLETPFARSSFLQTTEMQSTETASALFRIFTLFIDTFMTAFNFFDGSEPPTSIYEKHVLIQIYYHFFEIPFAIGMLLQPMLLVAWKVYLATMAILGVATAAMYVYLRWFRSFPAIIPHCQNVEAIVSKEFPSPIRGLDEEMSQLLACLNTSAKNLKKKPIMVTAGTGQGKTTLLYKLHQLIKKGEVSEGLREKKVVIINGSEIMAKSKLGIGDKIKEIRAKLAGFEKDTIVCIDEIQAIAVDPASFELIKTFMRTPAIQFVAITTIEGLHGPIKAADLDHSFRRPFNYISFGDWSDTQVKSLLEEKAYNEAEDLPLEDDVIDKVIDLSNCHLEDLPQPGKAIKLFDRVISSCRTNYDLYHVDGLEEKQMELQGLQYRSARSFPQINSVDQEQIKRLAGEIDQLKKIEAGFLGKACFLRKLIQMKNELKKQLLKDASQLKEARQNRQEPEAYLQKHYLFTCACLFPALNQLINTRLDEVRGKMDLRVDGPFVEKVFTKFKGLEDAVHSQ